MTAPTSAPGDGPGLHRTIMLTDAVVAIAITLLVLPLVEVSDEVDTAHPGEFLREHANLLLAFVISFRVIYVFWAAHAATVRRAEKAGAEPPILRRLTPWWLLVVAFLPFPTALIGREATTVTAPFYIGTMTLLAVLTTLTGRAVDKAVDPGRRHPWAWVTTGILVACTALSLVAPRAGLYSLLLIAVARFAETWSGRKRA